MKLLSFTQTYSHRVERTGTLAQRATITERAFPVLSFTDLIWICQRVLIGSFAMPSDAKRAKAMLLCVLDRMNESGFSIVVPPLSFMRAVPDSNVNRPSQSSPRRRNAKSMPGHHCIGADCYLCRWETDGGASSEKEMINLTEPRNEAAMSVEAV